MKEEELIELSVVMPCLNEVETLATCIKKAQNSFKELGVKGEVIIGDNGSSDGSIESAEKNGARVIHQKLKGYGNALRAGIDAARGKYVIMGDADDSYDFSKLAGILAKLREGFELVMGCRMPRGGGTLMPGAMPALHKYFGNPFLSWVGRIFFKSKIVDFNCGLRGFSKEAYDTMNLNTTGMEFASEMVIKSTLLGKKVTNVPITLHPDGRSRAPHLRSWRDGWRNLRFMLLYSPKWLFFYPSYFLLAFGLAVMALVIPGPFVIGKIHFDTNTLMIGSLSVIVGLQAFVFAIFSRIFAESEGFLPKDPKFTRLGKRLTLETGLFVGGIFLFLGLFFIGGTIWWWSTLNFGDLPRDVVLRIIIPAITAIVIGAQIIFSSFFVSFLTLERK